MPVTSHLEGVGNDLAACAAITLVHYTPPPFIAFIVPCNLETVKLFLKILLAWMRIRCLKKPLDRGYHARKIVRIAFCGIVVDDEELLDYTSSK